jgi:hypothetical protein
MIIADWMDKYREQSGQTYIYWDSLATKIEDFIEETIKALPDITDETAVEQLQKSGWLARHDAEITRNIGMQEFVNAVMAKGDKSVRISIDPWRWED